MYGRTARVHHPKETPFTPPSAALDQPASYRAGRAPHRRTVPPACDRAERAAAPQHQTVDGCGPLQLCPLQAEVLAVTACARPYPFTSPTTQATSLIQNSFSG